MLLSKCITCLPLWKCHTCLWTITLTCQNVSKPQRTVDGCRREAWVMHCCPELTKHYGLTFAHWDTQIQSVQGLDATWSVFKFQLRSPLNLQALSNWDSGGLWAITILQIQCFTQHGLCCPVLLRKHKKALGMLFQHCLGYDTFTLQAKSLSICLSRQIILPY